MRKKIVLTVLAAFMPAVLSAGAASVPFTIASTGQNVNSYGQDTSYTITSNTIKETPYTGPAWVVTMPPTPPQGWLSVPGSKWIAPNVKQDNSTNGCCAGIAVYVTTFMLADPTTGKNLDPSTAVLNLTLLADDVVDIYLYGTDPSTKTHVYSGGVYSAAANIRVAKGFSQGLNTLEFDVNNSGLGPTGLNIYATGSAQPLCLLTDGVTACPPVLATSSDFVTQTVLTGTPYNKSTPTLFFVRNTGGGGPQVISSIIPVNTSRCPANGGNYPFTWSWMNTTLDNDAAFALTSYGADPGGKTVSPGIYQANIRITAGNLTQDVCLVTTVTAAAPAFFSLSKSGLLFNAQVGEGTAAQLVPVFTGGGSVDWTTSVRTLPGDNFLTVTSAGTTTSQPGGTSSNVNVSVLPEATPGVHYGLVIVTPKTPGLMPTMLTVVYNVTANAPTPGLSAGGMVLIASPDSTGTTAQNLMLLPSTLTSQPYTLTTTTPFLSLPATVPVGSGSTPVPVSVGVVAANLKQGFNHGTIQMQLGGVTQTEDVLVLYLPTEAVLSSTGPTAACNTTQIAVEQVSLPGGFSQPAGWPAVVQARVLDDCGNPVNNATVVLNFSDNEEPLFLQLENATTGTYTATWTPAAAGSVTITTLAASGSSLTASYAASTSTPGTVTANKSPQIFRRGTVNNLYSVGGAPLAPGTVASVFGSGLAGASGSPGQAPLPTSFQGTTATIAGINAPLYYVSDGQLDLQIPAELPSFGTYPIVVTVNGAISTPDTVTVYDVSPGVVAFGDGTLIAQHANFVLVDASHPATPGETLIMYLGGMGATNPAVPTDGIAPSVEPLARLVTPVTVTVGGETATLAYAGLTPGGIGLYQIDFTVPPDLKTSTPTVVVKQNGVTANSTTLQLVAP